MDTKQEVVDLSLVVETVRTASDKELRKLAEISKKLDGNQQGRAKPKPVVVAVDTKPIEKAVTSGIENAQLTVSKPAPKKRSATASKTNRSGEIELSFGAPKEKGEQPAAESTATEQKPIQAGITSIADKLEQEQEPLASEPKPKNKGVVRQTQKQKSQPVIVNVEQSETTAEAVDTSSLDDMPDKVEKAVRDGLSDFDGYWKDANGKLRRSDGRYASKKEQAAYKTAEQTNKERETERLADETSEQTSVFAKLGSSLKQLVVDKATAALKDENDATDAAGAAAGGSFFYSAKELYHLTEETAANFEQSKERFESFKGSKLGKLFGFKPSETDTGEPANDSQDQQSVTATQGVTHESISATKDSAAEVEDRTLPTASERNGSNRRDDRAGIAGGNNAPVAKETNREKQSQRASVSSLFTTANSTVSRDRVERVNNTVRQTANHVSTSSNTHGSGLISKTKQQSYQANTLEVLKENSVAQDKNNDALLDKLDELLTATKANAPEGAGGGLMDLAGDLFDRKGRKGRRGGRMRKAGRGRFKSVLSGAGDAIKGVGSKGLSMAGGAFRGLSKVGSIAGKAVPFLAPALMAYDAISGFTDTEKQKEVFNLKDGQEATTGQKSSMALANVLDLGGLVSGGAGLLGSALGAFGFDGAKEALSFDSGDMAKGIYGLFGGDTKSTKETESQNDSKYEKNAEAYHTAKETNDTQTMRELDSKNSDRVNMDEVEKLASEKNTSFASAYARVDRKNERTNAERERVANELGMDTSGMIQHPELGQVYSPDKKADQIAAIDKEIASRKAAEQVTVTNARFVDTHSADLARSTATTSEKTTKQETNSNHKDLASQIASEQIKQNEKHTSVAKNATKVTSNERVSDIASQKTAAELRASDTPQTVKLDKESIEAIKQSGSDSRSTTTVIQRASRPASQSTPAAAAKSSGSIPNNFNDRSLQRQSADLE
ncbi:MULTISPECIES: hypothetical protein [unclassified Vibrio]|uniref:hypothetical protein n=1 Tax=unclassified Vibrio TaxID=2614977 RepID=UPI001269340A|nr:MULTISPECIES: hypothetical protein [unclassified Vibrio]QFT40119.1 hypothetical protein FIU99_27385 [Vibrio sp. THAF64]QGM37942.1 hypothetical protein GGC04_26980 [Vibrio sp. THAF191d]QGN73477.1 hypothetical protein GGC03_27190 [Vibrio sp. THAF191c]